MRGAGILLGVGLVLSGARSATAAEPPGPIVELPPMIVEATSGSVTWLYANVKGDEYLSRCAKGTTRAFIESHERLRRELRAIVPDEFLASLPTITLLSGQDVAPKESDQVARELLGSEKMTAPGRGAPVKFLPNLRLDDRDLSAVFAYIDESAAKQIGLVVSASQLRLLLERRTPMLPPWLIEGILSVRAQIDVRAEAVTLRPFGWLTADESRAIARNPTQPRALLPANEMFAPDSLRGDGNHHPRRVQALQAQVGLFVRWALDPRNEVREAFWAFAQRSSEQRVTEEMFAKSFGFGFSDLRDRLNDYLPIALKEPLHLEPGAPLKSAPSEIREATPAEIAQLRGTWERLEIGYVQRSHPEFVGSYTVQARRTLRRPYERGEHDPRLLAELGLCEIDAGDPAAGLPLLETAITANVGRPRAYYEVARLRFTELMRGQVAGRIFSAAELAPVVEPLRRAADAAPPLPEAFGLLADAWVRSRDAMPAEDIQTITSGAKYFAMNPAVSYRLALALACGGRRVEAAELLATGAEYVADEAARTRYAQLQAVLSGAVPAKE